MPDEEYIDDEDYDPKKDDDEDVDPKLAKAVMIGGIAAAVVVALIIFIIVGNVMGWFKFGSSSTEASTVSSEQANGTDTQTTESEEKVIEMIEVMGYTQLSAEKSLKDAGFTNIRFEEAYDEKVKASYVIGQNHQKGEKLPQSTEIVITVSIGAEEVEVPDVTGYTDEQATKVMTEAGFSIQHSYEFSDTVEKDSIIRTEPAKQTKAGKGSKIILVTSNGPEQKTVKVPNVTGISESAAKSSLEAVKLSLGKVSHEYSDSEAGVVIRQSYAVDTVVNEGTAIDIVVSDGQKVVTYTGSVSGSISASDEEFLALENGVSATVYITDGTGSHQVINVDVSAADKANISISGSVTGLSASDGAVTIEVVDSTTGADVTAYYHNSLTLTFTQE